MVTALNQTALGCLGVKSRGLIFLQKYKTIYNIADVHVYVLKTILPRQSFKKKCSLQKGKGTNFMPYISYEVASMMCQSYQLI